MSRLGFPLILTALLVWGAPVLAQAAAVTSASDSATTREAVRDDVRLAAPTSNRSAALIKPVAPIEKKPGAIVIPIQNCGNYNTGWVEVPNADVNPCPKSCLRGEQLSVTQHPGDSPLYSAWYHCYLPEMFVNQSPDIKQSEEGAPPRKNCGTHWTSGVDDPNAEVNPCPKNCERGELRSVSRNIFNGVLQYEMNYQCYVAEGAPKVIKTSKIEISGLQPKVIKTSKIEISGLQPKVIKTPKIEISGLQPKVITTPKIEITGLQTKVIIAPKIEITGVQ